MRFGWAWMLLALSAIASAQSQTVVLHYGFLPYPSANVPLQPIKPTDAKLPSLPHLRCFALVFSGGQRLFALAESQGQKMLYADTDGDNDLTDEQSLASQDGWFGPVPLRYQVNGVATVQHYRLRLQGQQLFIGAAGCWMGVVSLAGRECSVRLRDANADGIFDLNDILELEGMDDFLPAVGCLAIDGIFMRYQSSPVGNRLTLEWLDLPSGKLRFKGNSLSLRLERGRESWAVKGTDGKVVLPVGTFRLNAVTLARKDERERLWWLSASSQGADMPLLPVGTDEALLDLEPLRFAVKAQRNGTEWLFELDAKTANGLRVTGLLMGWELPPEPRLRLIAPDGTLVSETAFHYG